MGDAVRILFLAADPSDKSRLRLGKEYQVIKEELSKGKHARRFEVDAIFSVKVEDMTWKVHDFRPHLIHFSGHGAPEGGLSFEDETGTSKMVAPADLEDIFKLLSGEVDCVIFNACYSESQAKTIVTHVPYVVGLKGGVSDKQAICFSLGFYQALSGGRNIPKAFEAAHALVRADRGLGEIDLILLAGQDAEAKLIADWSSEKRAGSAADSVLEPARSRRSEMKRARKPRGRKAQQADVPGSSSAAWGSGSNSIQAGNVSGIVNQGSGSVIQVNPPVDESREALGKVASPREGVGRVAVARR